MAILGIPNTRLSDSFIRYQLLNQVQTDQIGLLRVQEQLSTGRKIQTPSDDPITALQVIGLQRILSRNAQVQSNLTTNQSYLSATDSALSQVASLIDQVKGDAQAVMGTMSTDVQRRAAAQQVEAALQQLIDTGNQQFRGRYLFSGSSTGVQPFRALAGNVISYEGNENHLVSLGHIDLLFDTNVTGNEVFGTISDAVRGTEELLPALTFDTPLADLRSGQGIRRGSISISDGQNTQIVDLSKAETIGDVARLIHSNPPQGNAIDVEVGAHGLMLHAATGSLTITEVGGTTAEELGILTGDAPPNPTVIGADLHPALRPTTQLSDVCGTRARAILRPSQADNDMIFQADHNGLDLNDVTVSVVDNGSVQAGHETAVYDSNAKTLTVYIQDDVSTASQVIAAVNAAHDLDATTMPFTASLDPLDNQQGGAGTISVSETPPALTHDGGGTDLDRTHGLQIVNGQYSKTVDLSSATTVEELVNTLNSAGIGLLASINDSRTGIDVRTRLSGADFSIGENGGITARQLGIRTFDTETSLEQLNFGRGVSDYGGPGIASQALMRPGGTNCDFVVEARASGPDWDGYAVSLKAAASGDPEHIDYDPANRTIDVYIQPGVTTANQVVAMINGNGALSRDFTARIDPRDDPSNDGTGKVSVTSAVTSGGTDDGADFSITRNDGVTFEIDIGGAKTIGDVIKLINDNEINKNLAVPLVARPAAYGNGIELVDNSVGTSRLTVTCLNGSTAANALGLVPAGAQSQSSQTQGGQPDLLTGADVNPQETSGMFTGLVRLQNALLTNDTWGIERALKMIEDTTTDMNFSRAELGARQQGLDVLQARLDTEELELQQNLSDNYDVDLAQVISDLVGRQTALQASLQATAKSIQMNLLNYL